MADPVHPFRPAHLLAAAILLVMAGIAFINALSRYFLHLSFAATEEITVNLFVWLTVIGSGLAFERGGQLGMVTLYQRFPRRLQRGVIVFGAVLSAGLFVLVDLYTLQAIRDDLTVFHARSPGLDLPLWLYYLGVPLFSVSVFLGVYRDAVRRLRQTGRPGAA